MFKITRTTSTPDQKEILKFPTGLDAVKSVVLDAQRFTFADDGLRHIVPAGTILKLNATGVTTQYEEYAGSGTIQGILAHDVDIAASTTAGAEPAPMFFHGCIFATTAIVGFTQYASALVTALPTCKFE
jgi:hypothetical protein